MLNYNNNTGKLVKVEKCSQSLEPLPSKYTLSKLSDLKFFNNPAHICTIELTWIISENPSFASKKLPKESWIVSVVFTPNLIQTTSPIQCIQDIYVCNTRLLK